MAEWIDTRMSSAYIVGYGYAQDGYAQAINWVQEANGVNQNRADLNNRETEFIELWHNACVTTEKYPV